MFSRFGTTARLWAKAVLAAGIALSLQANAAPVVDTRLGADGAGGLLLNAQTPNLGQSIVAQPDQITLNNFSYWIGGGAASSFSVNIYDLTTQSGPLYTSAPQTGNAGPAQEYKFLTPGVTLTPFDFYIFLLSFQGGADQDLAVSYQQALNEEGHGNAYRGFGNAANPAELTYIFQGVDLDFRAEFGGSPNSVPEPASLVLLGLGLAGLGFARRRKRKLAA